VSWDQAAQVIGILGGVIAIGSLMIGVLVYALRKKRAEDASTQADRVIDLANEELALLRARVGRMPELETQVKVLREEVGAARAIAQLEANMQAGFAKMAATLDAMDRRGQKADRWQARFNRGTVEGLNRLLVKAYEAPIQVEIGEEEHRR
jgi:hypothetical protein